MVFNLVVTQGQPVVVVSSLLSHIICSFSNISRIGRFCGCHFGQLPRTPGADTADLDMGAHHLAETIHGVGNM